MRGGVEEALMVWGKGKIHDIEVEMGGILGAKGLSKGEDTETNQRRKWWQVSEN